MTDERTLIKKAQKGDVESFEEILYRYQSIIYNISYRFAGSSEDAEDMTQEVFIKIFRNINSFQFKSKLSTWIYRVTTNTCLDIVKRKKDNMTAFSLDDTLEDGEGKLLSSEIADSRPTPDKQAEQHEIKNAVNKAISQLPEDYRAVVILRDIHGLPYDDIAEIVDCSVGTVKSRISRGRRKLREILLKDRELFDEFFV